MRVYKYILVVAALLICLYSIQNCKRNTKADPIPAPPDINSTPQLKHVNYFVDNSGGMFGYVSGFNNFISSVSELAQKADFVASNISKQFYFVNGYEELSVIDLGSSAFEFTSKLNPNAFNVGDIQGNDLNKMFQFALTNSGQDTLSIFITDAIYDIQQKNNPLNSLVVESRETRRHFITRLSNNEDIQTLIIKLSSDFSGSYYYGSKFGQANINMSRPFYVFVFGVSSIVNNFFDDNYIESLGGYENHSRYFVTSNLEVPYTITSYNQKGAFRFDKSNSTRIINSKLNKDNEFQFSLAADVSSIPIPINYLLSEENYDIGNNFEIINIEPPRSNMYLGVSNFTPNLVYTIGSSDPYGRLSLKLLNNSPIWIGETDTVNDSDIVNQPNNTWGFKYLISGIEEAYIEMSKQNYIINFQVDIE